MDGDAVSVEADVEIDAEDVTAEDIINGAWRRGSDRRTSATSPSPPRPKAKTMELFGRQGPDGKPVPFHVYSMRQAIEEGFILDVLKNYTSYTTFYKLGADGRRRSCVPQKQSQDGAGRYAKLHPHNIAQKVVVIVEHFREHVAAKDWRQGQGDGGHRQPQGGGPLQAGHRQVHQGAEVHRPAHAGRVLRRRCSDPESGPDEFTESNMNADIKGQEPSEAFKQRRVPHPAGGQQVPDRLRPAAAAHDVRRQAPVRRSGGADALAPEPHVPGKEDTFVLDFVNKPEEILASFQPYYRTAQLEDVTDPNIVHELMTKLNKAGVYFWTEVEQFAEDFFNPKVKTQGPLHRRPEAGVRPL